VAIRSTAMAQLYAILTPDQQTKLGQMQAKIRQLTQQLRGGDLTAN
jgi:Spy/CpxP family protein refolding chaperone